MCDIIGIDNVTNRVHVQLPGQVFNKHIDKLEKYKPEDPNDVMRIMVFLTDYRPGQFLQFGNYTVPTWRSGDICTFDWYNLPHSSANAGTDIRVSMLTTGIITDKTREFLNSENKVFKL